MEKTGPTKAYPVLVVCTVANQNPRSIERTKEQYPPGVCAGREKCWKNNSVQGFPSANRYGRIR